MATTAEMSLTIYRVVQLANCPTDGIAQPGAAGNGRREVAQPIKPIEHLDSGLECANRNGDYEVTEEPDCDEPDNGDDDSPGNGQHKPPRLGDVSENVIHLSPELFGLDGAQVSQRGLNTGMAHE